MNWRNIFKAKTWGRWIAQGAAAVVSRLGVTVKIDDTAGGWVRAAGGNGPADMQWSDKQTILEDSLRSWKENFFIRQIVRLTTAYVVGDGIEISSTNTEVNEFLKLFWSHPENNMNDRLPNWCDELTRAGELFPILHTNKLTGMSHVRIIPASHIVWVETDKEDYEKELSYSERVTDPGAKPRKWKSDRTAKIYKADKRGRLRRPDAMMLHYCINKPVGATRGEGDLEPVLTWVRRYVEWLKDRIVWNKLRVEMAAAHVKVKDRNKVAERQEYYDNNPPIKGRVIVTGPDEEISFPAANIQGFDSKPDGEAQRLAVGTGVNLPQHFFSEGTGATKATATQMSDPTHRHYRTRQQVFKGFLVDLSGKAYIRFALITGKKIPDDLGITATVTDISRADNSALAQAAKDIAETFSTMRGWGWISDKWAVRLIFKFAGELISEEEIDDILKGGSDDGQTNNNNGKGEGQADDAFSGNGVPRTFSERSDVRTNGHGQPSSILPALSGGE